MTGAPEAGPGPTRTAPATVLRVVGGSVSPDDLAAVVAVVTAVAAAAPGAADGGQRRSEVSGWTEHARRRGAALRPGPGAWRRSAWDA